ncbi:hypothetical protein GPECTOR_436g314 [Gonium pectorale]|uniref:Uncharacterized protein n=1 Tax=Gonium pectorale TaxID=33097 RepID=A0A150FV58_GONPE|nr:hypothetical protein GPECTOR_436g314 [Gonium pectorale]|eukprot:KXZ41487.1 hypothetical protein GPECTOR_436g314 [Gonium pectorale]
MHRAKAACASSSRPPPAGFFVEGLLHRLRCCLASPLYDTRATGLKGFVRYLAALDAAVTAAGAAAASPAGGSPTAAAAAAAVAAAAAHADGGTDAGGKLAQLVSALVERQELLGRLVSEAMALLWEAVASEPIHKVARRALKALGLLHAISTTVAAAATAAESTGADAAVGGAAAQSMDPITCELQVPGTWCPVQVPGTAAAAAGDGLLGQHPPGCLCCADPRVGANGGPGGGLQHALQHVALVQRLLAGCRELEARCEALRCLGRALGGAAVAAAEGGGATGAVAPADTLVSAYQSLVEAVAAAAQPWRPEDWRLAAAEALAASQLLQAAAAAAAGPQAGGGGGAATEAGGDGALVVLAMRAWRCVVMLLEDEDHGGSEYGEGDECGSEPSAGPRAGAAAAGVAFAVAADDVTATAAAVCSRRPLYVEAVIRRLCPWLVAQYGGAAADLAARDALAALLKELVAGADGGAVPEVVSSTPECKA